MPHDDRPPLAPLALHDPALQPWQPGPGASGKARQLQEFDPAATPYSCGDKTQDKAAVQGLADELDQLQEQFYVDRRYKLLVILQGTDTAGKDGTLRVVFGRTSPLGVRCKGWRAPSEEERAHDFLWRIHQALPAAGEWMLFNRSHYEDVLVPPVNGWIDATQTHQRYAHINDFERLLVQTGTVVVKFLLHISYAEQRRRLQARIDDPAKHWKFSPSDLQARQQWPQYQAAYDALLQATHTPWAPWTVVPADSKTHRNLMVARVLRDVLVSLQLQAPAPKPDLLGLRVL